MNYLSIDVLDARLQSEGWTKVRTGKTLRFDLKPERVRRRYNSQSLARKVESLRADRLHRIQVTDDTVWRAFRDGSAP